MPQRYRTLLLSFALLALATLVYWPGLSGGFLFDDYPNILTNSRIHAESLSWQTLKTAAQAYEAGSYGRPLATISFTLNYLIGGKDPSSYKVASLLVHLGNALLVFWLLCRLLALPRAGGKTNATWRTPAAFTIALLWAIHPLQVSSVLYIVQRMETLSLTFVLFALIVYLRGRVAQRDGARGWPWLALSGLLASVGMLSKETAVLFPAYALALELTVLRFDAQSMRTCRFLQAAYAIGLIISLTIFVGWIIPQYVSIDAYAMRDFTLYERLLSQLRILPMYLGQMLLPLPGSLMFYYDNFPKSTGWLNPASTLAGGALLLALLVAAWRLRQRMPLVVLGILWFFAAHLLTSNVFPLELVFEHRNYFALLGVLLALADLIFRIPMRDSPALKYVGVGVVVVGFGLLAAVRSATWGDPLLLAMDMAARNPGSARASNDLGEQFMNMSGLNAKSPFYAMATKEFERGSRLPGSSPLPEQGLILMATLSGQAADPAWWNRLNEKIGTRPIGPQEQGAIQGLMQHRYKGLALDDQQLGKALATMFRRSTMPPGAYAQYADYAMVYLHDEDLAERMFVAAIDNNPTDSEYATRILGNLVADGRTRQANAVFKRARQLGLLKELQAPTATSNSPASSH